MRFQHSIVLWPLYCYSQLLPHQKVCGVIECGAPTGAAAPHWILGLIAWTPGRNLERELNAGKQERKIK